MIFFSAREWYSSFHVDEIPRSASLISSQQVHRLNSSQGPSSQKKKSIFDRNERNLCWVTRITLLQRIRNIPVTRKDRFSGVQRRVLLPLGEPAKTSPPRFGVAYTCTLHPRVRVPVARCGQPICEAAQLRESARR